MLRILLVDDHPMLRQGLKQILRSEYANATFGEAQNGPEATKMVDSGLWDVVVLDLAMPGGNGFEALKHIKQKHSALPVLILSNYPEDPYAMMTIKAGAAGYLNKESAPEKLVSAVEKLLAGDVYISPAVGVDLVAFVKSRSKKPLCALLTDREFQVLCLIVSGREGVDIGNELSETTEIINTDRGQIFEKMNMTTNAQLSQYVFSTGAA